MPPETKDVRERKDNDDGDDNDGEDDGEDGNGLASRIYLISAVDFPPLSNLSAKFRRNSGRERLAGDALSLRYIFYGY